MPTFILLISLALCISAPIYLVCYWMYGYNKSLPLFTLLAILFVLAWRGEYPYVEVIFSFVPMAIFSAFGAYFFSMTKQGVDEIDYALTFLTLLLIEPMCLIVATTIPLGDVEFKGEYFFALISFFAPNVIAFLLWCWQKRTGRLPVEMV